MSDADAIPIIGGTGALGFGLATRLAAAGREVVIGSRSAERAAETAGRIRERLPEARAEGLENGEAATKGPIVFLTVPFRAQSENLNNLRGSLSEGQLLVDCTSPLAAAVSGKATRTLGVWQGSAAQQAQEMVPDGVTVVAAFHSVGAAALADLDADLDEDVLICGDRKADKARLAELVELIPGLRAVNAGALETARIVEQLTALLISINSRYKTHAGIWITNLPAGDPLVLKRVALLAGGTGGAKLAAGVQELIGDGLSVIANTADDCEAHGLRVSPDPDLVTYWLADEIDAERGWGIRDDSFTVHERLEQLGAPGWFQLSDRDLATCLYRTEFMAAGGTLTAAQGQIARSLGAAAAVLPMCEARVRTRVRTPEGWRELQEFLILDHGEAPIAAIEVEGLDDARPTSEVLEAVAGAEAIVIGPSNPVISIGPILSVPGMREAIAAAEAPVLAVSPLVAGRAVKGPTEAFMAAVGRPSTAAGVASLYEGLIDAMVVDADDPDEGPEGVTVLSCPTLMEGAEGRRALAERVLDFAAAIRE